MLNIHKNDKRNEILGQLLKLDEDISNKVKNQD
jgi:hypothetical protein